MPRLQLAARKSISSHTNGTGILNCHHPLHNTPQPYQQFNYERDRNDNHYHPLFFGVIFLNLDYYKITESSVIAIFSLISMTCSKFKDAHSHCNITWYVFHRIWSYSLPTFCLSLLLYLTIEYILFEMPPPPP
jgi:hypothetical protein